VVFITHIPNHEYEVYNFGYRYNKLITYHKYSLFFTNNRDSDQIHWITTNDVTLPYIVTLIELDKKFRSILKN